MTRTQDPARAGRGRRQGVPRRPRTCDRHAENRVFLHVPRCPLTNSTCLSFQGFSPRGTLRRHVAAQSNQPDHSNLACLPTNSIIPGTPPPQQACRVAGHEKMIGWSAC